MFKNIKAVTAVLLILCMALIFTSCYGNTNEFAMEIDGEKIDTGVYLGYTVNAYSDAKSKLSKAEGYSEDKIFDMTIEEKSVSQWIKDNAIESCKLYAATNKIFKDYKCEFTAEVKTTINKAVDTQWTSGSQYYEKNGCSKVSFRKMLETSYKQSLIFQAIYEKGGAEPVEDAEIKKFFEENFIKAKITTTALTNAQTYQPISDEDKVALNTKFDAYVERIKKGEDIDKVLDEYNQIQANAQAAASGQTQKIDQTNPNRNVVILYKKSTDFPAEFTAKLFEMAVGSTEKFEIPNYLVIANKISIKDNKADFDAQRANALTYLKQDEFKAKFTAVSDASKVVLNDAAISRFDPKNIPAKFVTSLAPPQTPGTQTPGTQTPQS